jgi:hypothetical protein
MAFSTDLYLNFFSLTPPGDGVTLVPTAPVPVTNQQSLNPINITANGDPNVLETGDTAFEGSEYTGFSVNIGGADYAVFGNGSGTYYIPHSGEAIFDTLVAPPNPVPSFTLSTVTDVSGLANCFLRDTHIATDKGEKKIQDLQIGDIIRTADGGMRAVKWIGRQVVVTQFKVAERLRPVRISAGALGGNLPVRDLHVTADHALFLDGVLINASALINGTTIDYIPEEELGSNYVVYHVETDKHDVIFAEGCAVETFIDYVARSTFHNASEYTALYGDEEPIIEMPYARITSPRKVPASVKALIGNRDVA